MQKSHGNPLKKVLHIEVQWKKENKQLALSLKKNLRDKEKQISKT